MSPGQSSAQSIWANHTGDRAFLFFDTRARTVGDLVTVIISQQTDVDTRENRSLDKESESAGSFGFNFETGGGLGTQAANAAFDMATDAERNFDGRSNYRSAQEFNDRVAATVCSVLPNGNLVLSARREVFIAGESRTLILSGTIRPIDLRPDNSVLSSDIADFILTYEGDGPSQAFTRQNWLARRINRLWPF